MSLEASIAALTEAVNSNTAALERLLSKAESAKSGGGTAAADEEKPKRTRKTKEEAPEAPKDEDSGDDAFDPATRDELKGRILKWLSEFKENEADPETNARKEALAAALGKLGGEGFKVTSISNAEQVAKLTKWFEKKLSEGRLSGPLADDEDDDL